MSIRNVLALVPVFTVVFLLGCEKEIKDGRVPAEYVSAAQPALGTYLGKMEGQSAKFTLSINSDRVAKVVYSDSDGDIVGKNCGSRIGALIGLDADSRGRFKGARFALTTKCNIEGDSVYLGIKKNGSASISIVESSYQETEWVTDPGDTVCDEQGHCHSIPGGSHPETHTYYNYLTGQFIKQ